MAITSNINQANLQTLRDTDQQIHQEDLQRESQIFRASEAKKARDFEEKMYNLKAGDIFLKDNPDQDVPEKLKDNLGEHVYAVYEKAGGDLVEGKKLLLGSSEERRRGQSMIAAANNSIKELAEEYMRLEGELTEYVNDPEMLESESGEILRSMNEAQIDGKLDIVSGMTAGSGKEGDMTQYVRWTDENGETQYKSLEWMNNAIKGGVKRLDIEDIAKRFSDSVKTSKHTDAQGRSKTLALEEATYDTWIDDVVNGNEGKNMSALIQQFGYIGQPDAPQKVRDRLRQIFKDTKAFDRDDEATYRPPVRRSSADAKRADLEEAKAHRKWQVQRINAVDENGLPTKDALAYLEQTLKANPYVGEDEKLKGQKVTSVDYDKKANQIIITYHNGQQVSEAITPETAFNLISLHSIAREGEQLDMASTLGPNTIARRAFKSELKETGLTSAGIDRVFDNAGTDEVALRRGIDKLFADVTMPVKTKSEGWFWEDDKISIAGKIYKLTKEELPQLRQAVKDFIATHQGTSNDILSNDNEKNNVPSQSNDPDYGALD